MFSNPDNPASATSYPMSLDNDGFSASLAPSGLAVTNEGMVYFDTGDINGTGTPLFHELNTVPGLSPTSATLSLSKCRRERRTGSRAFKP